VRHEFASGGLKLVGELRLPDGPAPAAGWPALVLTGPLSGVKEQVVARYAEAMTQGGMVTLAFDHRNFGESEGIPRCHEDPQGKLEDLAAAVSALGRLEQVNATRVGCLGVCLGGGYALRFAAFEPRVSAVACVASGFNSPYAMREGMGTEGYRGLLASFAEVQEREQRTGDVEYLPAVAPDDGEAVMQGAEPWEYYGTERSSSPFWENRLTRLSIRSLVTTDLLGGADFISPTPLLVVHGRTDAFCAPELAQQAFDRAGEPKEILWLDTTNHIDLYDNPQFVEPAVRGCVDFFKKHLGV
jgi:uncharacterized protein